MIIDLVQMNPDRLDDTVLQQYYGYIDLTPDDCLRINPDFKVENLRDIMIQFEYDLNGLWDKLKPETRTIIREH